MRVCGFASAPYPPLSVDLANSAPEGGVKTIRNSLDDSDGLKAGLKSCKLFRGSEKDVFRRSEKEFCYRGNDS